jgi:hypothetical protein
MTAPELTPAEQALWDRPAAPESVVEQLAAAIAKSDGEEYDSRQSGDLAHETDYRANARAAFEHLMGRPL